MFRTFFTKIGNRWQGTPIVNPVTIWPIQILGQASRGSALKLFLEVWMKRLTVGDTALDFTLPEYKGLVFKLSDLYRSQNVLLVFNLGFI
jgi:hypothetical protein